MFWLYVKSFSFHLKINKIKNKDIIWTYLQSEDGSVGAETKVINDYNL